jgi:hypothetical protein
MRKMFTAITIAGIAGIFLLGCRMPSPADVEGQPYVGTLKLVAKYKPLHLYIYADTLSTNKFPEYAIFQRNNLMVASFDESNTVQIILSEKDFKSSLTTTYNLNGQILRRVFDAGNKASIDTNYMYFDTNVDGLWDHFVIDENGSIKSYDRSNLCWVPRIPNQK